MLLLVVEMCNVIHVTYDCNYCTVHIVHGSITCTHMSKFAVVNDEFEM